MSVPYLGRSGIVFLVSGASSGSCRATESHAIRESGSAKHPGIARSLEYPDASGVRPGYPTTNLVTPKFRIQYTGIAGCDPLEYDEIRSTRTAGASAFVQLVGQWSSYDSAPLGEWAEMRDGVWTVESVATGSASEHFAQCYTTKKGNVVPNGAKMHMPFRTVIIEAP